MTDKTKDKDLSFGGLKPISIILEDFDKDGNVQNSIPIQFTAGRKVKKRTSEEIIDCSEVPFLKHFINLQIGRDHDLKVSHDGPLDSIDIYQEGEALFEVSFVAQGRSQLHYEGPRGAVCTPTDKIEDINEEKHQVTFKCKWKPELNDWYMQKTTFCSVAIVRVKILSS